MDGIDGRLTLAAGGLMSGARGKRENVDQQTAEKLERLVRDDDEALLSKRSLNMIVASANLYRRRSGSSSEELTVDDIQAWIFWRQFQGPPESVPPEPEPEPLEAKFKIKLGYGGKPVDMSAGVAGDPVFNEDFHVVVCDDARIEGVDRPRSITVWRLGHAADADTAVSSGVLHGCRAVRCHHPPGAFKVELANMPANIPDGQESSGSYYFLPVGHQSSEELVAFFNKCGSAPPRLCADDGDAQLGAAYHPAAATDSMSQASSSVRHTWSSPSITGGDTTGSVRTLRDFEVPEALPERPQASASDVPVLSTKIIRTEQSEDLKGAQVTQYVVECTPLSQPGQNAGPWIVRKRYSQFDEFRKELEAADSSSDVDTLGLKAVPFPAKTWGIATVGKGTVDQRQQKLQDWLNKIVGLNNALLCSDHRELADAVQRFLRPENDSMPLTMDQLQSATDSPTQSVFRPESEPVVQATEDSWRADQLTGNDGYLQSFEHQLFPSSTIRADGEDSIVQDLEQLLANVSTGAGGRAMKSEADRLTRSVQAALRDRDETISQLTMQRDKLQRQLDGAAQRATENAIALFLALGKGAEAKALTAASEREATD